MGEEEISFEVETEASPWEFPPESSGFWAKEDDHGQYYEIGILETFPWWQKKEWAVRQDGLKCIYMWNPKYDTSELKYKTETDSQT